jgi:hypothetical protein
MNEQEESSKPRLLPDGPPWTVAQERAYQELLAQDVIGLPASNERYEEAGLGHPALWFLIGLGISGMSILLATPPAWNALRTADDQLVLREHIAEMAPLTICAVVTLCVVTMGGRALGALTRDGAAFQFIGETLILARPFGESLLDYAVRGGKEWSRVRRRWVGRLWTFLAIPLAFHVWTSARAYSTYRAVFEGGIREIQFGQVREYRWENLRTVRTYCDESRKHFFYELKFKGGTEFELIRDDKQGVAALRDIDRKLVDMGMRKEGLAPEAAARCARLWRNVEERSAIEAILLR